MSDPDDLPPGVARTGEPTAGLASPRDYPLAVDEWGTTAAEEELGESLEQRLLREEPELGSSREDGDGVAIEGREVPPDSGSLDLDDVAEGLSAEEEAVRVETDPAALGLGRGPDGYLDDDPGGRAPEAAQVELLYRTLLDRWNARDADGFAALFTDDGSVVGFDGTGVASPAAIADHLRSIFRDHHPATYHPKVREVRPLGADVALLRAVVGMVPPGGSDIAPEANALQVLVAVGRGGQRRIAHFQNTPAAYHGRPEAVASLTAELRAVVAAEQAAVDDP